MKLLKFEIGDWSNDGHGRSETIIFNSSHTKEHVGVAFKAGIKDTGFVMERLCSDYDERSIKESDKKLLLELGFPEDEIDWECMEAMYLWDIFAFFVHRGDPTIQLTIVEPEEIRHYLGISSIGYGLFCD